MAYTIFRMHGERELRAGLATGRTILFVETDVAIDPAAPEFNRRDIQQLIQSAIESWQTTGPPIDEVRLVFKSAEPTLLDEKGMAFRVG